MSVFYDFNDPHFWVFIALLVFGFVLWRVGAHGMIGKALDEAGAKVQAQLDEAARLHAEARNPCWPRSRRGTRRPKRPPPKC